MWTYKQRTGELFNATGEHIATGYSGFGAHKNQPADDSVKNLGPIPEGRYAIGQPRCVAAPGPHGPFVLPLTPLPSNQMFGRDGFLLHGDSIEHPGTASHGCVILPRAVRERIAASGDTQLEVVAE
jgi:hypothetical protein